MNLPPRVDGGGPLKVALSHFGNTPGGNAASRVAPEELGLYP